MEGGRQKTRADVGVLKPLWKLGQNHVQRVYKKRGLGWVVFAWCDVSVFVKTSGVLDVS